MSKAVLISIQPKWCDLIANGKKTIEVRKSRPKIETPFKVYIYCTSVKSMTLEQYVELYRKTGGLIDEWQGKVIGEFVCDTFVTDKTFGHDPLFNGAACMSEVDAAVYSCQSPIYGWHISDLVIYDKPKELSEFRTVCKYRGDNDVCKNNKNECYHCNVEVNSQDGTSSVKCAKALKRPPQSWCYVEEREDNA